MHQLILIWLLIFILFGCTPTNENIVDEPVGSKRMNNDSLTETIIIYGKLHENVLHKPTKTYYSAFGHAYCMAEEVSFDVLAYILGSGPKRITFTQNIVDSCLPLAADIHFEESILFLSKNQHRGIWSTASIQIKKVEGESRIYRPSDIMNFISFNNFDALLREYEKPFEWGIQIGLLLVESNLKELKAKGILDYRLDPDDPSNSYYLIEMYKYISIEALLNHDF